MSLKARSGRNLKSIWTDWYQKYNFDYVVAEIEKKQEGAEGKVGWSVRFWIGKRQWVPITESIK